MPTYDYVCDACQHSFEAFQGINDKLLKKCPRCSKPKLRRLFGTGSALLFKGSGFYVTDYRSSDYKAAAQRDQEAGKAAANGAADTASPKSASDAGGPGKKAK
jgi:putative FmdB family regulatory protein